MIAAPDQRTTVKTFLPRTMKIINSNPKTQPERTIIVPKSASIKYPKSSMRGFYSCHNQGRSGQFSFFKSVKNFVVISRRKIPALQNAALLSEGRSLPM